MLTLAWLVDRESPPTYVRSYSSTRCCHAGVLHMTVPARDARNVATRQHLLLIVRAMRVLLKTPYRTNAPDQHVCESAPFTEAAA